MLSGGQQPAFLRIAGRGDSSTWGLHIHYESIRIDCMGYGTSTAIQVLPPTLQKGRRLLAPAERSSPRLAVLKRDGVRLHSPLISGTWQRLYEHRSLSMSTFRKRDSVKHRRICVRTKNCARYHLRS